MNASGSRAITGVTAIPLPWREPMEAFRAFDGWNHVCFLHSGSGEGGRGRYSYLCVDPYAVLEEATPAEIARAVPVARKEGVEFAPFQGGAVGFFGYEAGGMLDRAPALGTLSIPTAWCGLYDLVLAFDHNAGRCVLFSRAGRGRTGAALDAYHTARAGIESGATLTWSHPERLAHLDRVRRAIEYIRAGDIYQANIAARFIAERPQYVPCPALFERLAGAVPAPFSAYIGLRDDQAVASVSPERFLLVSPSGAIETRPIKGTRRRRPCAEADAKEAASLLASPKDRAENLMIVDLLRHDLGRVCAAGSIHVPELHALETFSHVHHLVSCVRGQLQPGLSGMDAIRACFPGGSITGAPKVRAMEVIAELEGISRGPYCGCAFWLGSDGAMDSSILIRTVTIAGNTVTASAGGGIVADSDPEAEWDEVLAKITPILDALA